MNASYALLALPLLLSACDQPGDPAQGFAGLGRSADGFSQVLRGQALGFPADYGAHPGFRIEWWYVTANLKDAEGRAWGAQWTLFRSALRPGAEQPGWASPSVWLGHAALSGPYGHQFSETQARGGIAQAGVQAAPFLAWIDNWSLRGEPGSGLAHLAMTASGKDFSYRLQLHTDKPLVLHGDHGYSEKSGQGQASYYYSQPFYQVSGEVERAGVRHSVSGQAWLDREWSSQPLAPGQAGWDWFSLHLDSGAKLMLFQVRQTQAEAYRAGTWINPDGQPQALKAEHIQLTPLAWTRLADGRRVPTRWRVELREPVLNVEVEALQPQAWMGTRLPYWEGPVRVRGSDGGQGYLEMTGYPR